MALMPDDERFLEVHFSGQWEVLGGGGLLIRDYSLPEGYDLDKTNLMIRIPADYPAGPLDMFYLQPAISRKDGRLIGALAEEEHFSQKWQRWSRHYEWKPGEHCIATHFAYIKNALQYELRC